MLRREMFMRSSHWIEGNDQLSVVIFGAQLDRVTHPVMIETAAADFNQALHLSLVEKQALLGKFAQVEQGVKLFYPLPGDILNGNLETAPS